MKKFVFFLFLFFLCCFFGYRFFFAGSKNKTSATRFDNQIKKNLLNDISKRNLIDFIYYPLKNFDIDDVDVGDYESFANVIKLGKDDFSSTNLFNMVDVKQNYYTLKISAYDVSVTSKSQTGFDIVYDNISKSVASGLAFGLSDNFTFFLKDNNVSFDSIFSNSSNVNNLVVSPVISVKQGSETKVSLYNETPIVLSKSYDTETKNNQVNFEYKNIGFDLEIKCKKNSNTTNIFASIIQNLSYVSDYNIIDDESLPVISSRSFTSDIELIKHQSIILGSIRYTNEFVTNSDIFLLSKIPFVGQFFKNSRKETQYFDLILIISLVSVD